MEELLSLNFLEPRKITYFDFSHIWSSFGRGKESCYIYIFFNPFTFFLEANMIRAGVPFFLFLGNIPREANLKFQLRIERVFKCKGRYTLFENFWLIILLCRIFKNRLPNTEQFHKSFQSVGLS